MSEGLAYQSDAVIPGVRSRFVDNGNGLTVHVLEAGYESADRPTVLLLHGFPELAFSWRKVMPRLAAAGFHVLAPDQRGYGQTTGWDARYDGDLASFRFLNLVRDAVGVLTSAGVNKVEAVVGHDFGALVAAYCALVRPDIFQRMALMSAPFSGPPSVAVDSHPAPAGVLAVEDALASLPRPRKHYHAYYATPTANADMQRCEQGVHGFLRAYFHHKSADWAANQPFELGAWSAEELAKLPTYYVMDRGETMAQTVAHEMPSEAEIEACAWLTEAELAVYSGEYARTGFQGGLNWYRCRLDHEHVRELQLFAGRTIDVPSAFISGDRDWGVYQTPGALAAMQQNACSNLIATHLLPRAGHWVQQEQAELVSQRLVELLRVPL
ncbi:MAG: alpha/beta hydrolase [Gammaproteobacteria bacterium]|nr:alpha/beta hydrolase [Gammaproteobacteria bacterium]